MPFGRTAHTLAWRRYAAMLAAAGVIVALLGGGATFSLLDVRTILLQSSIVAIAALGATLVIAMGGLDLSVGSCVALCTVVAAKVMLSRGVDDAWGPVLAIIAAAATGAACGACNGLIVAALGLPAFIVTLGMLGFVRGLAKYVSDSSPVYAKAGWLASWVVPEPRPAWLLVPPAAWLTLLLAAAGSFFLRRTVAGRHAIAIGSNEEAATRCGVPVGRTKALVYALAGLAAGLAAVIQFARLGGSGDPTIQVGLELKAVAAAVIGGASLSGGRVSIVGTLCGAVLMSLLDNRCEAAGLPSFAQEMIVGPVIIVAVAIDRWRVGRDRA
ncbi:MAG: ABC transporter permease [Phycisphaerae bacterium]